MHLIDGDKDEPRQISFQEHITKIYTTYIAVVSRELHSSNRIRRQGKKDQQPSSNSGPTLYRGVSAMQAIDPSRDPSFQSPLSTGMMAREAETPR